MYCHQGSDVEFERAIVIRNSIDDMPSPRLIIPDNTMVMSALLIGAGVPSGQAMNWSVSFHNTSNKYLSVHAIGLTAQVFNLLLPITSLSKRFPGVPSDESVLSVCQMLAGVMFWLAIRCEDRGLHLQAERLVHLGVPIYINIVKNRHVQNRKITYNHRVVWSSKPVSGYINKTSRLGQRCPAVSAWIRCLMKVSTTGNNESTTHEHIDRCLKKFNKSLTVVLLKKSSGLLDMFSDPMIFSNVRTRLDNIQSIKAADSLQAGSHN